MTEELRLGLRGRDLVFPGGKAFCLVCGETPAGDRRVWFEDTAAAGVATPGTIGSTRHALGTGARAIAERIDVQAPLCSRHKTRALWIGLGAVGFMVLAVAVSALGIVLTNHLKIPRRYENIASWIAFLPALIPAGFGVYFWKKKDRGGLDCEARREGNDLVLTYPDRMPGTRRVGKE